MFVNKFGWCRGIADAQTLYNYGFDFIECPLASLSLEDEAVLRNELSIYRNSPIGTSAFNMFFPGAIKIVGPEANTARINRYIAASARVLDELGAQVIVLGSGKSRNIPDGWEVERAEEQMLQVLERIADDFVGTTVKLVIEPLNRKESNLINSLADAVHFARQINRPQIRVLADLFHMEEEKESLDEIRKHKDWLDHIHIADTNRLSPGTGQYPLDRLFANLQEIGYKGMISSECRVEDLHKELPAALAFITSLWEGQKACEDMSS
ncbi:MAG: sugar phosphate isomerase/epimerase [Paenibacillus sp.]|nr:sugar phosphate isomerase/epimerase [Paenibacillus sp.]